ncbi:MAG: hypothetical protein CME25_11440 [Gemmatimonadetes bacterium]|nr:hypothetical protein [Gemmatimonadota bacterium]
MATDRSNKAEYVRVATRGEGFASWQDRDVPSPVETTFREKVERRKDRMLRERVNVQHPALLSEYEVEQARKNVKKADWARNWFSQHRRIAEHVVRQGNGYVSSMIEEGTPWIGYSFHCPNCYLDKSFSGVEYTIIEWEYSDPDRIRCRNCGQAYPSSKYAEIANLVCPRMGRKLTFYENEDQQKHPRDRSGRRAYRYSNTPVDVCFSGIIRERKVTFMIGAARSLGLVYRMDGNPAFASRAVEILDRLTTCFSSAWLYHDWRNTVADCDPLYAAWYDQELPLEFKRNVFTYTYENDTLDSAAMQVTYWGAGRFLTSTGGANHVAELCQVYDLTYDAKGEDGKPLWTRALRERVERDLFLEWMMEAEPFLGGVGKAKTVNNKAPRVYNSMAAVGKCLGITDFADTGLKGYEAIRDQSFGYDGFSHETPSYNEMYLQQLLGVSETLHGFRWPKGYGKRKGRVDLYATDRRLRLMLKAELDCRRPDGRLLTLGDTHKSSVRQPGGSLVLEVGMRRYPEEFGEMIPAMYRHRGTNPSEYAALHLDAEVFRSGERQGEGLDLPETYLPNWMNALLRHGEGMDSTVLSLTFNPAGGHRHYDNLALYYADRGREMLGDHGYLAEAPMQRWVKHTFSHNLVIVDDEQQLFRTGLQRRPALEMMLTSPRASVVEASSKVYEQCRDFRRLIVLLKGPGSETVAVDIFRVLGGDKHDFRVSSEVGASDSTNGDLSFDGIEIPAQSPLAGVGASQEERDIFGLKDSICAKRPSPGWRATWKEKGSRYRMWMLSGANRVEVANGPGQEMLSNAGHIGRRLRYVDTINKGKALESTFVALHEPGGPRGKMPVLEAKQLMLPKRAGKNSVAIKLTTNWGDYLIFSECIREVEVEGVRFKGRFGIYGKSCDGVPWVLTSGAETMKSTGIGFEKANTRWSGNVTEITESRIATDEPRPRGWKNPPEGVKQYVRTKIGKYWTGFPVKNVGRNRISVERYPLQPCKRFELLETRYLSTR